MIVLILGSVKVVWISMYVLSKWSLILPRRSIKLKMQQYKAVMTSQTISLNLSRYEIIGKRDWLIVDNFSLFRIQIDIVYWKPSEICLVYLTNNPISIPKGSRLKDCLHYLMFHISVLNVSKYLKADGNQKRDDS